MSQGSSSSKPRPTTNLPAAADMEFYQPEITLWCCFHRVLYSSHIQQCWSKWSSILLLQSCIMSICFKWCFPVDLIGADSCRKRTELCISVDIWYEFHGQTSFLANMWFPWPHISSHCALNCTVICHCSHSEISDGAFNHYSFTHCCSSCVFCKIQTADWWNYTSLKFTWIFCVICITVTFLSL